MVYVMTLTQKYLKEILSYNPQTGLFAWAVRRGSRAAKGQITGYTDPSNGYIRIRFDGKLWYAHHLAWLYVTGNFPIQVEHKDRVRTNNIWTNLRLATQAENTQNTSLYKNSTSGHTGVCFQKGMYCARITAKGVTHFLGYFNTVEEAALAYAGAKKKIHTFNPVLLTQTELPS